jgi:hypothetical protein
VFLKRGPVFNSLFLKILFFLTFSLDRNNIGCPPEAFPQRKEKVEGLNNVPENNTSLLLEKSQVSSTSPRPFPIYNVPGGCPSIPTMEDIVPTFQRKSRIDSAAKPPVFWD